MPTLNVTKTYADGDILLEADLDSIRTSIQTFFNTTKIDNDNIQDNGISQAKINIIDDAYLEFGTGNDGRIGVTSDNLVIESVTSNMDIIFKGSLAGVPTEVMRIDGSAGTLLMNSKKIQGVAASTANGEAAIYEQVVAAAPPGVISAYSSTSAPSGWLLCDGSAVSRTTYAALYAIIGITAGQGDGSTTFNVPDFRGRFLRGRDAAQARDPDAAGRTAMATGGQTGDNLFSIQGSAFAAHTHTQEVHNDTGGNGDFIKANGSNLRTTVTSSSTGASTETRPINAYVQYIIKT